MDFTEKIISYLECEYEIIKDAKDVSIIMKKYKDLLVQGKAEGFTPLVIVPSNTLCEAIDINLSYYNGNDHRDAIINTKARAINATEFLNNRIKEVMPPIGGDEDYDIMGEFSEYEPTGKFNSLIDYVARQPYETIIIAKIPTDRPWELAAWIPMGGWNECPTPEEQVAVFEYWHEKYGAIPAVVHSDIWELYVEKPPSTKDDAIALALEQFGFCVDIVWQGTQKVNVLASTLVDSNVWYFWWD